ncbi:sulfotransferase [Emcibacter nanhaiensis]|uniref:Uncharacterized protein n=1 Tax=Emcibacter nanhaiensis TaxID=1505037 RepID=A0A501PB42_9PROT|nr:sulfotransferase [Emcibacter nanhaiensis]TPD57408.1 hypothetical protein FIV46_14890 [Emcibacter nanhaiensis]
MTDNFIILVGAGRSGTTMMRKALAAHSDVATADFELNYLWCHGNVSLNHDMLDPDLHYTEQKGKYIREKLEENLRNTGKKKLIEKTVANVLRVSYVHKGLPEAKFIHIIRDGRGVTASAMKRWTTSYSGSYLFSKSRTIPITDLPVVAFRFFKNRIIGKLLSKGRARSWGPRWPGMEEDAKHMSLAALCAKQWKICVETGMEQCAKLPKSQFMEIRYEELVQNPVEKFTEIAKFLGISPDDPGFQDYIGSVITTTSLDKWKEELTDQDLEDFDKIAGPLLRRLGYSQE